MEAPRRRPARKPTRKTVYDSLRLIHRSITEMQELDRKQEALRIGVMIGLVDLIELMGFDEEVEVFEKRICPGGELPSRIIPLRICKSGQVI
jgi:hypothetical protein